VDWTSLFTTTHPSKLLDIPINDAVNRAGVKQPLIGSRGAYML